jgi:hypothetical protein
MKNKHIGSSFEDFLKVPSFLDPENVSVQLDTIQKAAAIVGKRLIVMLDDLPRPAA